MDGLIAYILSKQYADEVGEAVKQQGFKVQVEQDRSILQTTGQEKIYYFLPKENAKPGDGYDEYIWTDAGGWEQTGVTDVDLSNYVTKPEIGDLEDLDTEDKTSIVAAINELANIPFADTMQF